MRKVEIRRYWKPSSDAVFKLDDDDEIVSVEFIQRAEFNQGSGDFCLYVARDLQNDRKERSRQFFNELREQALRLQQRRSLEETKEQEQ